MFRLSQKADYGLILLSSFARSTSLRASEDKSNSFLSVSSIAKGNKISAKFLSQIAQELKHAGILKSREGVRGGYTLAKKPDEINLLDILKILDGELVEGKCFEDEHECTCGAGDMWKDVKKQLEATIGGKTVADLVV